MALTTGVVTIVSSAPTQNVLSATAATGGTGPYTYQWYRSTVSGFTPGGGNILAGKTALSLTDTGLTPGTQYYYKLVSTDTGNSNITVDSAQASAPTPVVQQNVNQFAQSVILGMTDLRFNANTVAVQIDASQVLPLYAGQAVKMMDSADGVPKVVSCAADSDEVMGFINFDIKNASFLAGMAAEISMAGNCIYLMATAAIARGARVQLEVDTVGGVAPLSGSSGADIVGWAYDKASAAGSLIRVMLSTPSFAKA